jgi:hypothetical protein
METEMISFPRAKAIPQLALFDDRQVVPRWSDLNQPTQSEAVRLLAQLLLNVLRSTSMCVPQRRGGHDE